MLGRWLVGFELVCGCARVAPGDPARAPAAVPLPDGAPGIGFDDLAYSAALGKVLVPSGRSGRLNLVDPQTLAVTSVAGFSALGEYGGGHDDGPTSVEAANGKLYVTDRTEQALVVVDTKSLGRESTTKLGAGPDYVRFVERTRELWVTEPDAERVEVFALDAAGKPVTPASALIAVKNGPESLVVDERRGRAYTHRWDRSTVAVDLRTHAVVAEWPNGCEASRGIALDEAHGFLFAACREGTATVLDVAHDGRQLSSFQRGSGFDVIGYSRALGHLYLAGGACRCLVVLGVNAAGTLSLLEETTAPASTHCATADDQGHAWLCDPAGGRVLRVIDTHPATLR